MGAPHQIQHDLEVGDFEAATSGLINTPGVGKRIGYGVTVPSSAAGWAPNALFWHDDGSVNARLYVNKGDVTTSAFESLTVFRAGEAITWTDGVAMTGTMFGGGSESTPITTATASVKFAKLYVESTATGAGSDTRAFYLRLFLNGATTGGGEALRAMTTCEKVVGVARGAHITLDWAATGGRVTGLGTALTTTLHVPNTGTMSGDIASLNVEAFCESGSDDDVVITGAHALIRATVHGDTGNAASFKNFLNVDVISQCVGNKAALLMVCNADVTGSGGASAYGLQVRVEGTQYWLPLYAIA